MRITRQALEEVRAHGEEGYPDEVCGIMVGPAGQGLATAIRRARNTVVERSRDRYELDPRDQIRVQRECDERGLDVIGYYHSHPDHPAQASVTDAQRSWSSCAYLIVAVEGGRAVDINAFVAVSDGGPMRTEPLQIAEG
ncbi:MAG: Mov34/MPN/PAD-1 family protein [Candidatus Dormibacteraceae bacterium]